MVNSSIIPTFLVSWVQLIVPQPCFDKFFIDFDFLDGPCLKIAISKCLGFAIIAGSCIVKVPQVVKILGARSGEGINLYSITCEIIAISSTWAYGYALKFPFSAYGEAVFLAFQTALIAMLVLFYNGNTPVAIIYVTVYAFSMIYLLSPMAPMPLLSMLQAANSLIIAISKIIQAAANYRNSSTGQLSAVTVTMLFLGALARIFTSIQETGDFLVICSYVVSSLFNGIILFQILYYWKVKPKQKKQ
ncbi:mannose-P-dolichol utilization defect 1 protein-like [Haliotis rubra]|uniref:mannose-P-dolichol utilization defect 1 protein-like n=1 Tax=Haliotis rubra TaxID=36100 RepID=UPI001EE615DE|nr:mannose-P-dolichol utilization defect 1 protein-like [Haliotis rubra]